MPASGVAARPRPAEAWGRALPAAAATALFALFLTLDHLPRFYQGDSIAYLATGTSDWVPPDRSWAYGYASRWIVERLGSASALVAAQAALLLGALLLLCRTVPYGPATRWAIPAFAAIAALDPMSQGYARFWLSDTPAAAAFLAFTALLAIGITAPPGRFWPVVPWLAVAGLTAVFVRVAYAPIMFGMLAGGAALASLYPARARPPRLRRRLLALLPVPVAAVVLLVLANSVVAIPSLRGKFFVNRMSDLYTLGVFLPGLRHDDFAAAGVPVTPAEFEGWDRTLDAREDQVWGEGPGHMRWAMMQTLGVDQVYDARFQQACADVLRAALRRHPQDLALTYLGSLAVSLDPARWRRVMDAEIGFGRPLPDWVATYLTGVTGRPVAPSVTAQPSLLTGWMQAMAAAYPALLLCGAAASAAVLALARPFGPRHVLALALLGALLAAPLFSHAVKPRYVLAPIMLSELLLLFALVRPPAAGQSQD